MTATNMCSNFGGKWDSPPLVYTKNTSNLSLAAINHVVLAYIQCSSFWTTYLQPFSSRLTTGDLHGEYSMTSISFYYVECVYRVLSGL